MSKIPAFGPWSEQSHIGKSPEGALLRAQLAETSPIPGSLDTIKKTARFYGSKVYDVSLSFCPCGGFRGKYPCKHIYRLAMELGIIDLPYETGISKGEKNETQASVEDCIAVLEQLSTEAQLEIKQMLYSCTMTKCEPRTSTYLCKKTSLIDELRKCPLLVENAFPSSEILSSMKRDELRNIIDSCGVPDPPKKNASKAVVSAWLLENISNISDFLPNYASFSFGSHFKKSQRTVYSYLLRKFEDESLMLEDGSIVVVPHGSNPPDFTASVSLSGTKTIVHGNPDAYYFPTDKITALLTKYGCNRCLNGFIPSKE